MIKAQGQNRKGKKGPWRYSQPVNIERKALPYMSQDIFGTLAM